MRASELLVPPTELTPSPETSVALEREERGLLALSLDRCMHYLELAKPRMNLLVLVVTGIGFYLASSPGVVDLAALLTCLVGVACLGAGAGALNQYIERHLDALMQRTERRPLPTERLRPFEALLFGCFMGVIGTLVLGYYVGNLACFLGAATFLSYIFAYTPLKRRTPYALLVGALPGALPPLIGWAAASGTLSQDAWLLFAVLFIWQVPHFTAIAWLYRDDYHAASFPMFPVLDTSGKVTTRWMVWSTLILIAVSLVPPIVGRATSSYVIGASVLGLTFFVFVVRFISVKTKARARRVVQASILYLPALLLVLSLEKILNG